MTRDARSIQSEKARHGIVREDEELGSVGIDSLARGHRENTIKIMREI